MPGWGGVASPLSRPALRNLFDGTARHYDRINALLSFGSGRWYRRDALRRAGLGRGAEVLDVATGTGLVAREARRLAGRGGRVVGLDPSPGMLEQARKSEAADALVLGRAEALPFADASFDLVSMGYALRHVACLATVFHEFRRVLRPGGRVLVLELARPSGRVSEAFARLYLGGIVPLTALLSTGDAEARRLMAYYWETIELCPAPEAILAAMREAGFATARQETEYGMLRAFRAGPN